MTRCVSISDFHLDCVQNTQLQQCEVLRHRAFMGTLTLTTFVSEIMYGLVSDALHVESMFSQVATSIISTPVTVSGTALLNRLQNVSFCARPMYL